MRLIILSFLALAVAACDADQLASFVKGEPALDGRFPAAGTYRMEETDPFTGKVQTSERYLDVSTREKFHARFVGRGSKDCTNLKSRIGGGHFEVSGRCYDVQLGLRDSPVRMAGTYRSTGLEMEGSIEIGGKKLQVGNKYRLLKSAETDGTVDVDAASGSGQ